MWYNGFEVKSVNKQQTHKERVSRQSRDLQFGDIVGICAPFEENLPDYYNGYNPLDVRGDYVTDGFGRTYKFRPVMVVGVSETELHFVPITHRNTAKCDRKHQYELQHTKTNSKYSTSFVECHNVRCIPTKPFWRVDYFGHIAPEDQKHIKQSMLEDIAYVPNGRDIRKYVPDIARDIVKQTLIDSGFECEVHEDKQVFKLNTQEHTLYDNGVLYYHYQKPLEMVQAEHGFSGVVDSIKQQIEAGDLDEQELLTESRERDLSL